ncbi:hypothetical protein ACFQX7_33505 [Luedemannella flava]
MTEPVDRIMVAFSGEGSGIEELTWGQRAIWNAMTEQNTSLPIGGWLPLPEGTTVRHMVNELRFHMSRHQSARMRLVFGDDGRPRQSVAPPARSRWRCLTPTMPIRRTWLNL